MEFFFKTSLTPSKSPSPGKGASSSDLSKSTMVKGSPDTISKYIYNDVQLVKQEIKSYNELTKVFVHNKLYYKLYKCVEKSHTHELANLKQKYQFNYSNEYYRELIPLYKSFLFEYEEFLNIIQYNYNNSILRRSRSQSITSSLDSITKDDDIPENLVDPLSYELFHDPVVTPSGITYEKSIIMDHLNRNGKFDPLTKQALIAEQLYPNLAIKNSVSSYIEQKSS